MHSWRRTSAVQAPGTTRGPQTLAELVPHAGESRVVVERVHEVLLLNIHERVLNLGGKLLLGFSEKMVQSSQDTKELILL
ncbi:hypothetical protein HYQ46_000342 [Verticillium longisporum]|nr:hypothetical protein HYQ46_000342 [Verticillium longisporum]